MKLNATKLTLTLFISARLFAGVQERLYLPKGYSYSDGSFIAKPYKFKLSPDAAAILVDLDHTLAGTDREGRKKMIDDLKNWFPRYQIEIFKELLYNAVEYAKATGMDVSGEQVIRNLRKHGFTELIDAFKKVITASKTPIQGMEALLKELLEKTDFNYFLATNKEPEFFNPLIVSDHLKWIHELLPSGIVVRLDLPYAENIPKGTNYAMSPEKKPHEEFFKTFLDSFNNDKRFKYLLLIDDSRSNLKDFVGLSDKFGVTFIGLHFVNAKDLRSDLVELGILS